MTPTPTASVRQSASSWLSSTLNSSPMTRHANFVPRSTYDPTPPTKTSSPLPSPRRRWLEYEESSQTSRRRRCNRVHYHPYCERCQTLMGWEPHQLTKPTPKRLIMSFGKLREYCESLPAWGERQPQLPKKVSLQWREEQFAQAGYKRNAAKAAQEARRRQARREREARGVAQTVSGTGTQLSTPSESTIVTLTIRTRPHTRLRLADTHCTRSRTCLLHYNSRTPLGSTPIGVCITLTTPSACQPSGPRNKPITHRPLWPPTRSSSHSERIRTRYSASPCMPLPCTPSTASPPTQRGIWTTSRPTQKGGSSQTG